jgi:CRP-like cAMP-binding protein
LSHLDRSLISSLPLFDGLEGSDLDRILSLARSVRVAKDDAVFEQGATAESFYLLLDGHVRVVRTTAEGDQVIARYIHAGELFGIAVAMGRKAFPASAVAAVDCVVLVWPNAAWGELSSRYPAFAGGAYRMIGNRLQETQARVVELSTEQVEQRVAHTLLRLANQSGRKTPEGIEIGFPITRQEIAEMTGTTLHTVSRLLSAWEQKGLIRGGRQKVTIADPHGLMLIAEHRRPG